MATRAELLAKVNNEIKDTAGRSTPKFRTGDTVKVHAKIVEGQKERIQVFQGIVIKRNNKNSPNATFTVRKISFNVGVERTFYVNSPRIDKIELVATGEVKRSKLFYLRPLRGKAARIKSKLADQSAVAFDESSSNGNHETPPEGSEAETKQDETAQSAAV